MSSTVGGNWSIYALIDPRDGTVRYVGKSVDVEQRVKAHLCESGSTKKIRWIQSLKRASLTPEIIILAEGFGSWEHVEVEWIAHFRRLGHDLTNATEGGEGLHNPSQETRAKIAAAQRSLRDNPDYVARMRQMYDSPSWRGAVSKGLTGKPKSPEHVAALPQNRKDYAWSEEIRAARRALVIAHAVPAAAAAPRTDAQRAHIARVIETNRGRPGWAKGRVLTAEERAVRSAALKGRSKSPETIERMREAALRRWARQRSDPPADQIATTST